MKTFNSAIEHVKNELFAGYTINIEQKLKNSIQFTAERSGSSRMYWLVKDYFQQGWEVQTCEYENAKTIFYFI